MELSTNVTPEYDVDRQMWIQTQVLLYLGTFTYTLLDIRTVSSDQDI